MDCPGCNRNIYVDKKQTAEQSLQHHLWGGHKIEIIRSHELAKKIVNHAALTEEERAELTQVPTLPL